MQDVNIFENHGLKYGYSLHGLTHEELNSIIPHYFVEKEFFISLYLAMNGGYFLEGAFIYRDIFYKTLSCDYNLLEVESFYYIPCKANSESDYLLSITKVLELRKKYYPELIDFFKSHFPFAADAGGNDFWININSGSIDYIRWESDINNVIEVSPNFLDFCNNLSPKRRKS
ncbi:hypothetical protein [Flavobacterium sp. FlaQc-48]|uniref:hypothetical protein n=1 Tax=Flavobacterium sp. FlaQc-48 TaxID=3374181 RepID=UPI003756927E